MKIAYSLVLISVSDELAVIEQFAKTVDLRFVILHKGFEVSSCDMSLQTLQKFREILQKSCKIA
jgi:DNA integrity scanning protein DisA with diadenylate cyclase activity